MIRNNHAREGGHGDKEAKSDKADKLRQDLLSTQPEINMET